jgi:hypothetical protein
VIPNHLKRVSVLIVDETSNRLLHLANESVVSVHENVLQQPEINIVQQAVEIADIEDVFAAQDSQSTRTPTGDNPEEILRDSLLEPPFNIDFDD